MTSADIDRILDRAESVTGEWDDIEATYRDDDGRLMRIVYSVNPFRHHNTLVRGPEAVEDSSKKE